tara:strand:+ start:362 stop:1954 length:1593 start_codon:yes stop_codon:yes gene_type:complete
MEHIELIIQYYYNSPTFEKERKLLEEQGKTKEDCLKIIRDKFINKDKLKEQLDFITSNNIKDYFNELSINNKINEVIQQSFENILKKTYDSDNVKEAFDKCIENISYNKKQAKLLCKIHDNLNKFTKEYIQKYFNKITFEKQTMELIRCNLSYIIKKDYGGNISCAIEQSISEIYKKQVVDFNSNINKVRMICIEEGIAFEELLTATFQNIEARMLEQSELIIKTERMDNHKVMKEYFNTIDLQMKANINKCIRCEQDIAKILLTLKELSDKFEKFNKNIGKQTIELIKRAIEQNINNKFEEEFKTIINSFFEPKINKVTNTLEHNTKEFKLIKERLNNIEKNIKKISDKQNKFEKSLLKFTELESKINNIENTLKINNISDKNTIDKNKKIEKLHNIIKDIENKLNKKYNDHKIKYNEELNKVYSKFKITYKQCLEVSRSDRNLIYKKIDDSYNKLNSNLPNNIDDIITKKITELNNYNLSNMTQYLNELNNQQMSTLLRQITDLQGQITMIHQFNQVTFNMPKTYLFQ